MEYINEGGNATTKSGESASKVDIKSFNDKLYEEFKSDIISLIIEINVCFREYKKYPLFESNDLITNYKIFSGSGYSFFTKSQKDFTRYKTKLGDIDVQIDEQYKADVKEFLQTYEGHTFAGFKLLGTQFGMDFFNVFKAPEKYQPMASNIQIDFEFIKYVDGVPDEFDIFSKNSDWSDLKEGIKGFAKQQLLPAIYKAVYGKPGVVFQNTKNIPSKAHKNIEVSYKIFGPKGSREKYYPVKDEEGNLVSYDGKQAYREIPVANSTLNRDLNVVFEEMFGQKPTKDEVKQMYSFVGVLGLMDKYLTKEQINRAYNFYYDDLSKRTEDEGVLEAIFNKFKSVFPFVKVKTENLNFDKYIKLNVFSESIC